jgi:catechol 2,3-dioxygenase-like lactoylglutathione lyase family enzyme
MSDQQIQKVKVKRLTHVGLWTNDVVSQAHFYRQILGLDLRATSEGALDLHSDIDEINLFFGLGDAPYCVGLYSDIRPLSTTSRKPIQRTSLHHLTFEVDTTAELAAIAAKLKLAGIELTLDVNDGYSESGDALWLDDPDGNRISIAVATDDSFSITAGNAFPSIQRLDPQPSRLQHVALYTLNLEAMVEFYTESLGFDISDWLLRERAWLRCNGDHHTLLLIHGQAGIEHIGFSISNATDILKWGDYLSRSSITVLWGPGRHGAGNDLFLRFADADGQHIELSTGMTQYYDHDVTTPPRLWHTRTTALNLWGALPAWIEEDNKTR